MDNYLYQKTLKAVWEKAVQKYEDGDRNANDFFDADELSFLASIGHSAQEVFDFAEDYVSSGEPDFATFALIADARRFHFLYIQQGNSTGKIVDTGDLPPKTDSVAGVEWLPRIIPKAKAKLRGEMSNDLMYCCGGDRRFFKNNGIHPAEFLRIVEKNIDNDKAVIEWVVANQ